MAMSHNNSNSNNCLRILLGVTGSVAAIKAPELVVQLIRHDWLMLLDEKNGYDTNYKDMDDENDVQQTVLGQQHQQTIDHFPVKVRILLTKCGKEFWDKAREYNQSVWDEFVSIQQLVPSPIEVYESDAEWKQWQRMGDPVLHIQLRDWANILLIAPLSANTLGKMANGLCDDTLSSVVRAWNYKHLPTDYKYQHHEQQSISLVDPNASMIDSKQEEQQTKKTRRIQVSGGFQKYMILAPAMNTAMWEHPLTLKQLNEIQSFGRRGEVNIFETSSVIIVPPQAKKLACGDVGTGALAPLDEIVDAIKKIVHVS